MTTDDPLAPLGLTHADLAPDDVRSANFAWAGLRVRLITDGNDAEFSAGYDALWDEFGDKGEMETRDVLRRRLGWRPETPTADGYARLYAMAVVRDDEGLAAVRDHSAVVDVRRPGRPTVVHLSHLLVTPRWRGSGLAGWMRALPLSTARACVARAGGLPRPVNLVAEMEPADPAVPDRSARLNAYAKAGFRKVDPARVQYFQPDFRPAERIAADGAPRPVPLSLVLRRVGRERETTIGGAELRAAVEAVYAVYDDGSPGSGLRELRERLDAYPADEDAVRLVSPSAA